MESLPLIILFTAISITFYILYRNTTSESDDANIIFKERGGGWVGTTWPWMIQMTWPFVTIHLYENRLLLNYGGKKVELLYSEITKVDHFYIPIIAEGVRVHHNNQNQPTLLRFWSFGRSKKIKQIICERMNKPVLTIGYNP